MEAGKRSINDIFNGNKILEIPFFQRSYVWDILQWERFISDMEHVSLTNKPYFLGSVILKQQLTNSQQSVGDKRTVIDGQQRLTTLNLFFKVLSLKTGNQYLSSLFRLPMKSNELALLHNHNDVEAFNKIMDLSVEEIISSEDNVTRAYDYFVNHVDPSKLIFQNILTNIMFVGIDLGIDEDEQQIFDTINSLGVKLTTAELLKNYLFSRDQIQLYVDYWLNVFEKDGEAKDFWDTEITAGGQKRYFIDLLGLLNSKTARGGTGNIIAPAECLQIYEEITKVRNPWRGEWLDASFSMQGKRLRKKWHITYNKINPDGTIQRITEPLDDDALMENKIPGIDLEQLLANASSQGLPKTNIPAGNLYYWGPVDSSVAGFGANSVRANLGCSGGATYSDAELGVRRAKILAKK